MTTIEVIRADGSEERHEVPRFGSFRRARAMIGGCPLDTVNLRDGRVMLVDDVGHLREPKPPVNEKATQLYHSVCKPGTTHQILGDVAIVVDAEIG